MCLSGAAGLAFQPEWAVACVDNMQVEKEKVVNNGQNLTPAKSLFCCGLCCCCLSSAPVATFILHQGYRCS